MEEEYSPQPMFRSVKRRKVFRKRSEDEAGDRQDVPPPLNDVEQPYSAEGEADSEGISEVIRVRRANKNRLHGVEFSSSASRAAQNTASSHSLATETDAIGQRGIADRFVPTTGQVVDVDKHMIAYIESEMAKRHEQEGHASSVQDRFNKLTNSATTTSKLPERQAAALGKLQEIDLGEDATLRNLQRTEDAIRRQRGEEVLSEETATSKKPRLGRNGKPRRGPKRRNSEDIKRDQLVEDLLRENRLDLYDESVILADRKNDGGDEAADEKLAEQFRQEFLDSMQARHKSRNPAPPKVPGDLPRGPKLGGSRSARAAMHRQMEAAKKA